MSKMKIKGKHLTEEDHADAHEMLEEVERENQDLHLHGDQMEESPIEQEPFMKEEYLFEDDPIPASRVLH